MSNKETPKDLPKDPTSRLLDDVSKVVGFDVSKKATPSGDALSNALKKIAEERQKEMEKQAEDLTRQVLAAVDKYKVAKSQFTQVEQAFQKEVKKLLSRIQRMSSGDDSPEEEEEEKKD